MIFARKDGFTLLEAIIALFILSFGILVVGALQERSIRANHSAFYRTNANLVALSFFEDLKGRPFDDTLLDQTSVTLDNDATAHVFDPNDFDSFTTMYTLTNGQLVDNGNRSYFITWAVADNTLPSLETPSKTIRLFMNWRSMMGNNFLEFTTIKYNNISL